MEISKYLVPAEKFGHVCDLSVSKYLFQLGSHKTAWLKRKTMSYSSRSHLSHDVWLGDIG